MMIRRHRRFWAPAAALLLVLPLIVSVAAPDLSAMSAAEQRDLAPPPGWPASRKGWLSLPGRTEAYLKDHFGLRHVAIHAYALLTQRLLRSGNASVLFGHDGSMFFLNDDMVAQSAGLVRRDRQVADTVDLLAAMHKILAARGIRMLVAVPPNSATVYPDRLPDWARNPGRPTEYDVMLADLAARGIAAVDLRPALREARKLGNVYYLHDTHWTARGALAGFNATVRADGHPDWALNAEDVLDDPEQKVGGDLAAMLGIAADVTEPNRMPIYYQMATRDVLDSEPFPTYTATSGNPGPTIMVIGDSFTAYQFAPLVLQHAARIVWLHHERCGFDWKWIEQFRPDEVWWMPTERFLTCLPDTSPQGFPPRPGSAP